jgi:surface antigen
MSVYSRHNRLVAFTIMAALAAQPVAAYQLGGLLGGRSSSSSDSDNKCNTTGESVGQSVLGGLLGRAARSLGIPTFVPSTQFSDVLATEIACRLDPEEQEMAAEASVEATRSGEVGSTATWNSDTRRGVGGSSTVTGRSQQARRGECLQVTDVIIVEGEETRVPKTMCRRPPATRYVLAA